MSTNLNKIYDVDTMSDVLDELPFWSAPFGLKLLECIEYKSGIKALDIGFGTGFPLTEIAMRLGRKSQIYGIDPWKTAHVRTRKKLEFYRITNVQLIEGMAENIPLEDNALDLITSNNGINNVTDIRRVISECARTIKPQGQFVFSMNTHMSMFEFYSQLEDVLKAKGLKKEVELMHQHIAQKRPSISYISELLLNEGFTIKKLEHCQFNYYFADAEALFNHYFIQMAFMDAWLSFLPKEQAQEIFQDIKIRMDKNAAYTGGISLSIPFVVFNTISKRI